MGHLVGTTKAEQVIDMEEEAKQDYKETETRQDKDKKDAKGVSDSNSSFDEDVELTKKGKAPEKTEKTKIVRGG